MENNGAKTGLIIGAIMGAIFYLLSMTSCSDHHKSVRELAMEDASPGLDRLMVEECGMFEIIESKGIAIDTSISTHPYKWKHAYYKLNADSTRYVMCK